MRVATLILTLAFALPALTTNTFTSRVTDQDERIPTSRELFKVAGNYSRYAQVAQEILDWQETRDLTELEHEERGDISTRAASCFPAIGFTPPKGRPPTVPAYKWWCPRQSEYAFLGFSYSVSGCPSKASMTASFKQMRSQYKARYVRIYGACESNHAFYDQIVAAAYEAGLGVMALVWFGFNGPQDKNWEGQLNGLLKTIKGNRYAPYVIRAVAVGSEPLYDGAIQAGALASKITSTKKQVSWLGIHTTTSEMAYKLAQHVNVLGVADSVQLNMFPFFSQSATIGNSTQAHQQIIRELDQMRSATRSSKKLIITQTGWPSNTAVWAANSKSARADVYNEKKYYDMLSGFCWTFKKYPQGGVGWFAHIWEDNDLPGWGIVKNGRAKFEFAPRISC